MVRSGARSDIRYCGPLTYSVAVARHAWLSCFDFRLQGLDVGELAARREVCSMKEGGLF